MKPSYFTVAAILQNELATGKTALAKGPNDTGWLLPVCWIFSGNTFLPISFSYSPSTFQNSPARNLQEGRPGC